MKTSFSHLVKAALLLSVVILSFSLFSQTTDNDEYKLVWSDEFDGDELDLDIWTRVVYTDTWSSNVRGILTDDPKNSFLRDGYLIIKAIEDRSNEMSPYTGARLNAQENISFKYGKFEARFKLPEGIHNIEAYISLFSADNIYGNGIYRSGMIDVMGFSGNSPNRIFGVIYTYDIYSTPGPFSLGQHIEVPNASDDFHTALLVWEPDQLQFYLDGVLFWTYENLGTGWETWPFDQKFSPALALDVRGSVRSGSLPQEFAIDYIRIYQKPDGTNSLSEPKEAPAVFNILGNQIQINTDSPTVQASIFSVLGEQKMISTQPIIDISGLEKGIYILSVNDGGKRYSGKFVKQY